jgi:acetyl-CoA carboxylase biotin carboxyl carrier protein
MDISEIKKIIEIVEKSSLYHFEYEDNNLRLLLKKNSHGVTSHLSADRVGPSSQEINRGTGVGSDNRMVPGADDPSILTVRSPLVGSVYLKDDSGEYFVTPGMNVTTDSVLCRLEAMKMFSDIKAPINGVIRKVLISEGELAEFDTPLFTIEKLNED